MESRNIHIIVGFQCLGSFNTLSVVSNVLEASIPSKRKAVEPEFVFDDDAVFVFENSASHPVIFFRIFGNAVRWRSLSLLSSQGKAEKHVLLSFWYPTRHVEL